MVGMEMGMGAAPIPQAVRQGGRGVRGRYFFLRLDLEFWAAR